MPKQLGNLTKYWTDYSINSKRTAVPVSLADDMKPLTNKTLLLPV